MGCFEFVRSDQSHVPAREPFLLETHLPEVDAVEQQLSCRRVLQCACPGHLGKRCSASPSGECSAYEVGIVVRHKDVVDEVVPDWGSVEPVSVLDEFVHARRDVLDDLLALELRQKPVQTGVESSGCGD